MDLMYSQYPILCLLSIYILGQISFYIIILLYGKDEDADHSQIMFNTSMKPLGDSFVTEFELHRISSYNIV